MKNKTKCDRDLKKNDSRLKKLPEELSNQIRAAWNGLYEPQDYPDEMLQPFPEEGDLEKFLGIVETDQAFFETKPGLTDILFCQLGYSLIASGKERTTRLLNLYKSNQDLLTQTTESAAAVRVLGNEANNFGIDKTLNTLPVIRSVQGTSIADQALRDLEEITYVGSIRYLKPIFERNVECYASIIKALQNSDFSDKEKADFLKKKPLSLQRSDVYINEAFDPRYAAILSAEISSGSSGSLAGCLKNARRQYISERREEEISATNKRYKSMEAQLLR